MEARLTGNFQQDCVFCLISENLSPAKIEFMDDEIMAIRPLNPVTEDHLLVIPRFHVSDFTDRPQYVLETYRRAAILAKRFDNVNLITSKGVHATQSVFHLHLHIIPRREGDGLHLPWTGQ